MPLAREQELPKSNDAPGLARDFIHRLNGPVPAGLVDDASLLVSEVVSNGVKYGGAGRIMLRVEADTERIRAEIVDEGSGFEVKTRTNRKMALADEGGWGLHLVETLADEWGVHQGSTCVWFEIRWD